MKRNLTVLTLSLALVASVSASFPAHAEPFPFTPLAAYVRDVKEKDDFGSHEYIAGRCAALYGILGAASNNADANAMHEKFFDAAYSFYTLATIKQGGEKVSNEDYVRNSLVIKMADLYVAHMAATKAKTGSVFDSYTIADAEDCKVFASLTSDLINHGATTLLKTVQARLGAVK